MVEPDVLLAKSANIKICLRRIREVTGLDVNRLENLDVQDIFVLNLQRAIQSAIDLGAHIISSEGLGLPGSLKENFTLLQQAGILPNELCIRLIGMVGFRNIAVHDYQNLDVNVLKGILTDHLPDLEDFTKTILKYFNL